MSALGPKRTFKPAHQTDPPRDQIASICRYYCRPVFLLSVSPYDGCRWGVATVAFTQIASGADMPVKAPVAALKSTGHCPGIFFSQKPNY